MFDFRVYNFIYFELYYFNILIRFTLSLQLKSFLCRRPRDQICVSLHINTLSGLLDIYCCLGELWPIEEEFVY